MLSNFYFNSRFRIKQIKKFLCLLSSYLASYCLKVIALSMEKKSHGWHTFHCCIWTWYGGWSAASLYNITKTAWIDIEIKLNAQYFPLPPLRPVVATFWKKYVWEKIYVLSNCYPFKRHSEFVRNSVNITFIIRL